MNTNGVYAVSLSPSVLLPFDFALRLSRSSAFPFPPIPPLPLHFPPSPLSTLLEKLLISRRIFPKARRNSSEQLVPRAKSAKCRMFGRKALIADALNSGIISRFRTEDTEDSRSCFPAQMPPLVIQPTLYPRVIPRDASNIFQNFVNIRGIVVSQCYREILASINICS